MKLFQQKKKNVNRIEREWIQFSYLYRDEVEKGFFDSLINKIRKYFNFKIRNTTTYLFVSSTQCNTLKLLLVLC